MLKSHRSNQGETSRTCASVHKSEKFQAAILGCEFYELNHPFHSQDFATFDYFLFKH